MVDRVTSTNVQVATAVEKFWETIPPVWNQIKAHIREVATEQFDITVEQFHILRHVHHGKEFVSELAEVKHISRPAISRVVDVLVNKGLLTRTQNPDDRRYVQLELTEAGRALLEAIHGDTHTWMMEKLLLMDKNELERVIQAMESLKRVFA